MDCPTEAVFPHLRSFISSERYLRVDRAVQALFQKTLQEMSDGLPFIITGDIPAMWLRDSTWQVNPLLKSRHPDVIKLLRNLSKTQVKLFLIDPFANAFNPEPNGQCWKRDFIDQSPWVFERKFELDSWASILYLARKIYELYGAEEHLNDEFEKAVSIMYQLARQEQNHDPESYVFLRDNNVPHDSLSHNGRGAPVTKTGLIFSAFRPSDDACTYGYLIPSNLFFMNELARIPSTFMEEERLKLSSEIRKGIDDYAVVDGIYAYEVDGLGNYLLMDDANVPSLLSLPYLEVLNSHEIIYQRTRDFILSPKNPYYFTGKSASGVGSQHTPKNMVWPIAIAIQALTSQDQNFQLRTLDLLEANDSNTGYMHESFNVDNPERFTRDWFSWSDMTYVDLVLTSVNYRYSSNLTQHN